MLQHTFTHNTSTAPVTHHKTHSMHLIHTSTVFKSKALNANIILTIVVKITKSSFRMSHMIMIGNLIICIISVQYHSTVLHVLLSVTFIWYLTGLHRKHTSVITRALWQECLLSSRTCLLLVLVPLHGSRTSLWQVPFSRSCRYFTEQLTHLSF